MSEPLSPVIYTWHSVCAKAIEPLLAQEISQLGAQVIRETHLGVIWQADLNTAYKYCLYSRLSSRLLMKLAEGEVDKAEQLYDLAHQVDWHTHFSAKTTFRVDFYGRNNDIRNTQFGGQKVKDGIVDKFRKTMGERPSVDKQAPIRIEARLSKGVCGLYLNFAGDSLHKRGYRLQPGEAPLKETLAAALLMRAGWPQMAKAGKTLVDPMCGSGTLVVEAALMAANIAPGCLRQSWCFEHWKGHDRKAWQQQLELAREHRDQSLSEMKNRFYGFDLSDEQLYAARQNIERAGLSEHIHLERRALSQFRISHDRIAQGGLLIVNPPYGERLSDLPQLVPLFQQLQTVCRKLPQWPLAIFTSNQDLCRSIHRPLAHQYNLLNGKIETKLMCFAPSDRNEEALDMEANVEIPAQDFANRLQKNIKKLGKWARREGIHCYRLYDADLPEYAVAIDQYEDWLHVQEYAAPKSIDESKAERRLLDLLSVLPKITGINSDQIVLKRRKKQVGREQYEQQAREREKITVREGQAQLLVNLKDYLDTGLFLDHRPIRLQFGALPKATRFLNLFCYTSTASVHAALAGCITTNVDLSRTYLNWSKDNFRVAGADPQPHSFIQADCRVWLEQNTQKFDVIFMDPPSFSNSKRMEGILDTQRDHQVLIDLAVARLNDDGVLYFSTNFKRFKLDESLTQRYQVEDITNWSIPEDFKQKSNIHQCFKIRNQA